MALSKRVTLVREMLYWPTSPTSNILLWEFFTQYHWILWWVHFTALALSHIHLAISFFKHFKVNFKQKYISLKYLGLHIKLLHIILTFTVNLIKLYIYIFIHICALLMFYSHLTPICQSKSININILSSLMLLTSQSLLSFISSQITKG